MKNFMEWGVNDKPAKVESEGNGSQRFFLSGVFSFQTVSRKAAKSPRRSKN
jgi:hypothetical protein